MSDASTGSRPLPDGLGKQHLAENGGFGRHASLLSLAILGALMIAALSGLFGGDGDNRLQVSNANVVLTYSGPTRLRNGMFFESHILVTARKPIGKLELAIDPSLVRDLTMNSMTPAAADETFKDGAIRYSFEKMAAGDKFDLKLDFQINPSMFAGNSGRVVALDGDEPLATLPVSIVVDP